MIDRVAYGYVRVPFALELLHFPASLLLHLSMILGVKAYCSEWAAVLYGVVGGSVLLWGAAVAFTERGGWRHQIESCPRWMWKTALALGVYALCTFLGVSWGLPLSSMPMAADAIGICLLYSVLWSGYLDRSKVAKKALHSILFVAVVVTMFLASRAGYLPQPHKHTLPFGGPHPIGPCGRRTAGGADIALYVCDPIVLLRPVHLQRWTCG
jgi:hypothetical protein